MAEEIRVLVAGTGFGRYYLKAIEKSDKLKLAGILSKGSEHSRRIAEQYSVKCYTDISEPDLKNIDLAVVAVRSLLSFGKGGVIAKQIAEKGVTVLEEQPVYFAEAEKILDKVMPGKNAYDICNFYRYMGAVKDFLGKFSELRDKVLINRIRASASIQALYPMLDILYDIVGNHDNTQFRCIDKDRVSIFKGNDGDTDIYLNIYNEYEPNNMDGSFQLLFSISIETDKGILTLNDPSGPLIWQNHFIMADSAKNDELENTLLSETSHCDNALTFSGLYEDQWTAAMEETMLSCSELAGNAELMKKKSEKILTVCRLWSEITKETGKPYKVRTPYGHL